MEIQELKSFIADPVNLKEEDFVKIQDLLSKYPFFQTAHLLFVKAAHNINHEKYQTEIQKVSATVSNREMLHELINLKEIINKDIQTEKIQKTEESQTRKDIRERIDQRRKKRQIEKGETLNENGKTKHQSLIVSFFKPLLDKLIKSPDNFIVKIKKDIPNTEIIEESVKTNDTDERERKKLEREKRMAAKRKLREEQTTDQDREEQRLERERRKEERLKLREQKAAEIDKKAVIPNNVVLTENEITVEKNEDSEEISLNSEIDKVSDKMITDDIIIKTESSVVQKSKENESVNSEQRTNQDREERRLEREKRKEERLKLREQKAAEKDKKAVISDNVVITEDEITVEKTDDSDESSLNLKPEINIDSDKMLSDDIIIETELPEDQESEKKGTIKFEQKTDNKFDPNKEDPYTKIIKIPKTEEVSNEIEVDVNGITIEENHIHDIKKTDEVKVSEEISSEKNINFESDKTIKRNKDKLVVENISTNSDIHDASDEIEVIDNIYDKIISSKKIKQTSGNDNSFITISEDIEIPIEISDDKINKTIDQKIEEKTDEIEFIVEDTTKEDENKVLENQIDEVEEQTSEFIEEDIIELIDEKQEDQIIEKTEDESVENRIPKKETKIAAEIETEIEAKAAEDVLARIAAFKNKRQSTKQETETETEKLPKKDLIQKFVKEKPSLKRNEIESTDNIDFSEESGKIKKPVETELMASIYINQSKYDQAIEIFEKLILKNPEKKDYFAAKIEEIKKLK